MIKKILIFTATYNEYPNIKILLDKINKLNLALDILIVDDYSNDGTLSFLKNYSKKNLCPNAEYLQPRILQFKTNYWKLEDMHKQARVLEKTLKFFGKQH